MKAVFLVKGDSFPSLGKIRHRWVRLLHMENDFPAMGPLFQPMDLSDFRTPWHAAMQGPQNITDFLQTKTYPNPFHQESDSGMHGVVGPPGLEPGTGRL